MLRASLLILLVGGCSPVWWGHTPTRWDREAFDREQAVRVVGCAELGFSLAREEATTGSLLLDVSLHNRCVRGVGVDLGALRVAARDESGAEAPMEIYDPRHEVRAYHLDALAEGTERLRIDASGELAAARMVCVDLSHVSPEASGTPRVCLYSPVAELPVSE